eukprot:1114871-Rhodomonas_salina.2
MVWRVGCVELWAVGAVGAVWSTLRYSSRRRPKRMQSKRSLFSTPPSAISSSSSSSSACRAHARTRA